MRTKSWQGLRYRIRIPLLHMERLFLLYVVQENCYKGGIFHEKNQRV